MKHLLVLLARGVLTALALLLIIWFALSAAGLPEQKRVTLPNWAKVHSVKTSFTPSGQCEVTLYTHAAVPQKTADRVSFCLYFYPPQSEVGVIFSLGNYPYSERPPSPQGGVFRAKIVHTNGGSRHAEDYHWIAPLRAGVEGNRISLRFPAEAVGKRRPTYLVVRYIPANSPIRTHQQLYDSIVNPQPEARAIAVRILEGKELERERQRGYLGINLSMFHP